MLTRFPHLLPAKDRFRSRALLGLGIAIGAGARRSVLALARDPHLIAFRDAVGRRDDDAIVRRQPGGNLDFVARTLQPKMQEVLGLADRIVVIFEGQIVAEFEAGQVDEQGLGLAMVGSGRGASTGEGDGR